MKGFECGNDVRRCERLEDKEPTVTGSRVRDKECVAEAAKRETVMVDDVHVTFVKIFLPFHNQLSSGWIVDC